MANIREYNMNGTLILGIDHGYGNIKTAHRVFPTALIKSEKAPTFSKDYLEYDGHFYIIGEGHKSFIAEKQSDDDNYILTLAAIAKELNARELTSYAPTLGKLTKLLSGDFTFFNESIFR